MPLCPWCPAFDPAAQTPGASHLMCDGCRARILAAADKLARDRDRPAPVVVTAPR